MAFMKKRWLRGVGRPARIDLGVADGDDGGPVGGCVQQDADRVFAVVAGLDERACLQADSDEACQIENDEAVERLPLGTIGARPVAGLQRRERADRSAVGTRQSPSLADQVYMDYKYIDERMQVL